MWTTMPTQLSTVFPSGTKSTLSWVPAPNYVPGKKVWLLAKHLHLKEQYKKLLPHYVGSYKEGSCAVHLKLPASPGSIPLYICPSLCLSSTLLAPVPVAAPTPRWIANNHLMYTDQRIWNIHRWAGVNLFDYNRYGPVECCLAPCCNILDPRLTWDFKQQGDNI